MATAASNIRTTLEMIKIEHTLFALPFAFLGALLAARGFTATGLPTLWQALWITAAMVGARSAAMAFNRIADREYDAANPRTRTRAIPAGLLSVSFVWAFTLAASALFFVAAAMLNRLTLLLSPVALAVGLATSARGGVRGARRVILPDRLGLAGARWRRGDGRASGLSTFARPRRRPLAPERGVLHHERLRQRDTARHVRRRGAFC